jgi:molybdenum cofactor cytidylyltransferase
LAADALHVVLLAAGAATRFGSAKQAALYHGQPLLQRMLERAHAVAGSAVSVVLGAHAEALLPLVSPNDTAVLINHNWQEGIASSIRLSIERLPLGCDGVLLLLADQVQVSTEDLAQLAAAWRQRPQFAVAAEYEGRIGAPAIFPRAAFPELLQLRGDRGAQSWLRANAERVLAVPMPSAAVDIDTPADLER